MNLFTILVKIVEGMSPEVRTAMSLALDQMAASAAKTKNPLDDIAVTMFRMLTGL